MKLTRRKLAVALLAPAAAAQQPPPPADDLAAARARLKTNADALAKVDVPMSAEPAFTFKA
jgi:hypothetical protein